MSISRKTYMIFHVLLIGFSFQRTQTVHGENTQNNSIIDNDFNTDYEYEYDIPEPSIDTYEPRIPLPEPPIPAIPTPESSLDQPVQEPSVEQTFPPPTAENAAPPSTIIASPPLELLCPPSPDFQDGFDPEETEEESSDGVPDPEEKNNDPPSGKESKRSSRVKVYFILIFSGLSQATFDQSKVVAALQNATRTLGAQSELEITIHSILNLPDGRRQLKSLQTQLMSAGGIKLEAEANFAGDDEVIAQEFTHLLSDSPSTIFPSSEFGQVDVPEFDIVRVTDSSILLPVCFGILGGLVICGLLVLILFRNKKKQNAQHPTQRDSISAGHGDDGSLPWGEGHNRSFSRKNLLGPVSSKEYSSPYDEKNKGGILVNNIGASFM